MSRMLVLFAAAALVGLTQAAAAQQPMAAGITLTDVAGVWDSKTMVGPKDSVIVTTVLTATADGKGWTMAFPNRAQAVAVSVVFVGGDSIVTEAGPFPSYLRPGQTVTLLHTVAHYKGDQMWGTSAVTYASGDKLSLKIAATRRK